MSLVHSLAFAPARFTGLRVTVDTDPVPAGIALIPRELAWSSDAVRIVDVAIVRDGEAMSLLAAPHRTERQSIAFDGVSEDLHLRAGDLVRLTMGVVTQRGLLLVESAELLVAASLAGTVVPISGLA